MFLSDFSIRRPIATVVLILGVMALGLMALNKLRVNQLPDIENPGLFISIAYPGASPDTVEREIVNRLEKSLQSVAGVENVWSTSAEGNARFDMQFAFSKNMIEAADEVRGVIASVRYKLPIEMREPVIRRYDPSAHQSGLV